MEKLYVYAGFHWLKQTEFMGELGYETIRGSNSYCFTFSKEWLKKHGDLFLSDDLNNYPGPQYTLPFSPIYPPSTQQKTTATRVQTMHRGQPLKSI